MNPNLNTIDQARRDISKPLNESNGITKTTRLAMGAVLILAALGCGASKEGLYASSTSDRPTNSDVSPSDISTVEDHLDSNSLDRFGDQDIRP